MKHPISPTLIALLWAPLIALHAAEPSASNPVPPKKDLPLPGEVFLVAEHAAFIIPANADQAERAKPWVWYAPTLTGLPGKEEKWMFDQFHHAGIAIAGIDVGESFGSPAGRGLFSAISGLMNQRYTALGGTMRLIVARGQGHNMWSGFFQSQELVNFVKTQASSGLALVSPLDYQVIQRTARDKGTIAIRGEITDLAAKADAIEARIVTEGKVGAWQRLEAKLADANFHAVLDAPAGGWHRLEVHVVAEDKVLAESVVEHVGVGEVFVVAGQSNAANHGEEKQTTKTGRVANFDGQRWQLANDPQPGASGRAGSFMPPFGDAIAKTFHVPVGIVACGVGATSVREWLPKGARFPNPPTLVGHVKSLPSGDWESKGAIFAAFCARMKQLGPHGFRAVLWHQGESDSNQKDPTRTLPGKLYREYLEKVIRDSRREVGWDAPWFVAQVSYHVPGDEASPDIRAAQASLWKDGVALEGPDSDALKGEFRENGGRGVHYSGKGLREHAARWAEQVTPWLEQQN